MSDIKKVIYADELRQRIVEDKQLRGAAFAAVMRHLEAVSPAEPRRVCPYCGEFVPEFAARNDNNKEEL